MKLTAISLSLLAFFAILFSGGSKAPHHEQVKNIFHEALTDGQSYEMLDYLSNSIGGRLSGSPQAAAAVEWAKQTLESLDIDTVYLQECMVPHWERGEKEKARILSDWIGQEDVQVCALGGSVGTGDMGITAGLIEVAHYEDIAKLSPAAVKGKIVFLNHPMDQAHYDTFHAYGECTAGRYNGAPEAAKMGAVGIVIRSLASGLNDYPHTGSMGYQDGIKKIPAAALSTAGAEYLSALLKHDSDTRLHLRMTCQQHPDALSYNVIGEIRGTEKPEEIVLVGGHLDSWDLADGAHDDGAGTVHAIETLRLFKDMNIKPKRTVRCVLFMNEENGQRGARKYAAEAKAKGENHVAAIESDRGGFAPRGWKVDAEDKAAIAANIDFIEEWLPDFKEYGVYDVEQGFSGVDIKHLKDQGTICLGFFPDPQRYFDYHHAPNDTFDKVNQRELELGAGTVASLAYVFAEYGKAGPVGSR